MSGCLTDYLAFMLGFWVAIYGERWVKMARAILRRWFLWYNTGSKRQGAPLTLALRWLIGPFADE